LLSLWHLSDLCSELLLIDLATIVLQQSIEDLELKNPCFGMINNPKHSTNIQTCKFFVIIEVQRYFIFLNWQKSFLTVWLLTRYFLLM
jgi:hypothetical protein